MHIDKVGNGQNLLPVSMKHTMEDACIYITSNCIYKDLHSDKYIQCIKLLMYNIKGEGLPATDTDPNEECPPLLFAACCAWVIIVQDLVLYLLIIDSAKFKL